MKFNTQKYRQLELFIKTEPGKTGSIYMVSGSVRKIMRITQYRKWMKIAVTQGTTYELTLEDCEISYAYLSDCEQMMDRGICLIEGETLYERPDMKTWYDTPNRSQYHFMSPKGYMGHPCSFCFYRNYYHLFYLFNPFSEEPDEMYWGHAVSKDLIRWVHLPVCMEPQKEILDTPQLTGGVFGGHAFIDEEQKLRLFFTRHISKRKHPEELLEYQVMTESWDGVHFERETTLIPKPDEEIEERFCDPNVFKENNEYKMLLGTRIHSCPAVVLYKSTNVSHWIYEGSVFHGRGDFLPESPDLFRLDGKYVLTVTYSGYKDEVGRVNPSYYHIGEWVEDRFYEETKGIYDFGGELSGIHSIETKEGKTVIGCIGGTGGIISIPRVIHLKENRIYQNPVRTIYNLMQETIYKGTEKNVNLENIRGNCYHVVLKLQEASDFRMTLYKWKNRKLYLEQKDGKIRFHTVGMGAKNMFCPADINGATEVEIFVDRNVCEVYLNGGQSAGTKKFYQNSEAGNFELHVSADGEVEQLTVEKMKNIW